jgi:hypothetical protein
MHAFSCSTLAISAYRYLQYLGHVEMQYTGALQAHVMRKTLDAYDVIPVNE